MSWAGSRPRAPRTPRSRQRAVSDARLSVPHSPEAIRAAAYCEDEAVARLLDDAWAVFGTRPVRVHALIEQAVEQATALDAPGAEFFAHLSRALLSDTLPVDVRCTDLGIAVELLPQLPALPALADARARRLLAIAEAALFVAVASPESLGEARERFKALSLASAEDADDPDDFFVLQGRAAAAIRVGPSADVYSPLYAALMLAGRTGHHGRRWIATATLASQLFRIGQVEEALELLEPLVREMHAADADSEVRIRAEHWMLRGKILRGRSTEAHAEAATKVLASLRRQQRAGIVVISDTLAWSLHDVLVRACLALGRRGEAQRHLVQATRLAQSLGEPATLATCDLHAAHLAAANEQMPDACQFAQRALDTFALVPLQSDVLPQTFEAWELLAECQAACGDFEAALQSHRRCFEVYAQCSTYLEQARIDSQNARHAALAALHLSARELDCLRLCANGKTASEIGEVLGISQWTAVYHLNRIRKRFGLSRRQQMVARAVSLGLVGS